MSTRSCHRKSTRPDRKVKRQAEAKERQAVYDALTLDQKKDRNPKKFA